jgi:phosphopantothenoylcysteine decarboxylase/phosphopantothenate--cysteine ligase
MPRTVVVGVSGGIAAYKTAYLVSALKKQGYDVHVLMTKGALQFVSALTFETLSGNAVLSDTFDRKSEYNVQHVALAKKAEMIVVAPATADLIARAAAGLADDMLTTTLLAARCPVVYAPAMNEAMYEDSATQDNIELLKRRGAYVMDTGEGYLACGDIGAGRMPEPEEILNYMHGVWASLEDMHGVRVLISAGPTREAIDPVRYISNRSSGRMGFAIAQAAVDAGADVTLVTGPVALPPVDKAHMVNIISAADMAREMTALAPEADVVIMAAAVADYTPKAYEPHKIKKGGGMTLELVRTTDVLKELGHIKRENQLLMGFAAETQNFEENALSKLRNKNLDLIALNDVSREGEGFDVNNNNIRLYFRDGQVKDLGSDDKALLARRIIEEIKNTYRQLCAR